MCSSTHHSTPPRDAALDASVVASTGYALANPGEEYLVFEPDGDGLEFAVQLAAGRYSAEWFNIESREVAEGNAVTADAAGLIEFTPPWPKGPAVLYLVRDANVGRGA